MSPEQFALYTQRQLSSHFKFTKTVDEITDRLNYFIDSILLKTDKALSQLVKAKIYLSDIKEYCDSEDYQQDLKIIYTWFLTAISPANDILKQQQAFADLLTKDLIQQIEHALDGYRNNLENKVLNQWSKIPIQPPNDLTPEEEMRYKTQLLQQQESELAYKLNSFVDNMIDAWRRDKPKSLLAVLNFDEIKQACGLSEKYTGSVNFCFKTSEQRTPATKIKNNVTANEQAIAKSMISAIQHSNSSLFHLFFPSKGNLNIYRKVLNETQEISNTERDEVAMAVNTLSLAGSIGRFFCPQDKVSTLPLEENQIAYRKQR